jgi:transcription elongation factor Elf1
LVQKGGRKGEVKAKAQLFLTMQVERTYVCPKCGYEQKSQTLMLK